MSQFKKGPKNNLYFIYAKYKFIKPLLTSYCLRFWLEERPLCLHFYRPNKKGRLFYFSTKAGMYFSIIAPHEDNTQETVLLWFAWVWRSLQVGFKAERQDEFHCGFPKEHLSLGQTANTQLEGSQWIGM